MTVTNIKNARLRVAMEKALEAGRAMAAMVTCPKQRAELKQLEQETAAKIDKLRD